MSIKALMPLAFVVFFLVCSVLAATWHFLHFTEDDRLPYIALVAVAMLIIAFARVLTKIKP